MRDSDRDTLIICFGPMLAFFLFMFLMVGLIRFMKGMDDPLPCTESKSVSK